MKTSLPLLALLCLHLHIVKAQVIFYEDFETDFETNSWLTTPIWEIGTTGSLSSPYFNIPSHTKFAGVNDDAPGAGFPSFGSITTMEIDLTGINAALLNFDAFFLNGDYDADETARVLISTDGMVTWQSLLDIGGSITLNNWQSLTVFLGNGQAGQPINLAFEYDDGGGWNYGFCVDNVKVEAAPDYLANVSYPTLLDYTISTPRQMNGQPLQLVHKIENFGAQPLNDISFVLKATVIFQGTVALDTHLINVPVGSSVLDTFFLYPTVLGNHSLTFKASHAELGADFYIKTEPNAFEFSDSVLAKDDSERDGSIGMSFGNPIWYGYYGSEFDLNVADTLTGITVWMTTVTAGSFNLKVNVKDSTGLPTIELFHSAPIPIQADSSGWIFFPLPSEMPLTAGNYVFAVGQDTIQGVMGHGLDYDRINPAGWIISPVAGGGYPWSEWGAGPTLMIRPHLKLQPVVSGVEEPVLASLKIYPNPATNYVEFDFENNTGEPFLLTLTDAVGQVVISKKMHEKELNVSHLPPGLYFIKIQNGERTGTAKLLKQ